MKKKTNGQKVNKGAPSGFVLSLMIHAAAFTLAGMLVVFNVVKKEEKKFVPPKPVDRPKMKLKKPKVKVKKSSKPKATKRIVTNVKRASMPDIELPEMSGMTDGLAGGFGGFEIMPDLSEVSIFGGGQSIGNDFEGEVYSLLHTRSGGAANMDPEMFKDVLRKYVLSGWKNSVLTRYYRSPKKLYSSHVMIPPMVTAMAPGMFGVPELEDYFLFVKYEGKLVYKEDIKFRFWGIGDAYIFVNVDGKEVLLNCWDNHRDRFDWLSSSVGSGTYLLGNQYLAVGEWIELKAGEAVDMKVLFGEWTGGIFSGMLLVEVDGVEYPTSRSGGPLLPAFKTEHFSWDTLTQICRFLPEDECTLTNGPVFNDYSSRSVVDYSAPVEPSPNVAANRRDLPETGFRIWTLSSGKTIEAEFITTMGGKAVLKSLKGRNAKVPLTDLSEDDRKYIRMSMPPKLDINFGKTTKVREFGNTNSGDLPPVKGNFYTFSTRIKQTSNQPYGLGLTAEYFVIGDEVGGNKHIMLDYQKAAFTLTEENDFTFSISGPQIELLDWIINGQLRGQKYGSFIVVVTDSRGEVVSYKSPRNTLYQNLDKLRKIRVGWYFDKEVNRCLPTRKKSWSEPTSIAD